MHALLVVPLMRMYACLPLISSSCVWKCTQTLYFAHSIKQLLRAELDFDQIYIHEKKIFHISVLGHLIVKI